ncbi:MAG TPA: orotate phosphoribosyltransferase [Candidatus Paceibacterota bacterium]|nr:MAG: orotate phosphoribosyltransferase [Parcubacteria group bacterium 21-58-10]OYV83150.1 MAG: orotate phosphoribosyltransferase [Parcubacteria group bacterium 37-58-5]HQT82944.1 orotate phosphoribosyltransferase [Candidatus Paceibacterota bacterium]
MSQKVSLTPAEQFVRFALRIGSIELIPQGRPLKNGRVSPYFFNAGLFNTGEEIGELAGAYSEVIMEHFDTAAGDEQPAYDILYGPPYKGTILVPVIAYNQYMYGRHGSIHFCSSRKEAKDHGEGGSLIGSPIQSGDRVLIVDDVITDGWTKKEAVEFIRGFGGIPVGLIIAFDRQERGKGELSAVQEFEKEYGIPVHAAATLADLISFLQKTPAESGDDNIGEVLEKILAYQKQYGVS